MYIATSDDEVIGNNKNANVGFEIKSSAKAFKILSNNLYKNKIRAIVRELSTNCLDAHKLNGNTRPFIISVPSWIDQKFVIRDFGPGLSPDGIFNLLCTYFASTKDQSNDFIGALGLGAKSPFSYTDSFIVKSVYEGVEYTFNAMMLNSEPNISLVREKPSNEHTGLEITVPVKSHDINKWEDEINYILYSFPKDSFMIKDDALNILQLEHDKLEESFFIDKDREGPFSSGIWAVYGNIIYPLRDCPGINDVTRWLETVNLPIYIKFPLGELDITPSREELSFDETTTENIINRVKVINDNMMQDTVVKILDTYKTNKIDGFKLLYDNNNSVINALIKNSDINDIDVEFHGIKNKIENVSNEFDTLVISDKIKLYNKEGANLKAAGASYYWGRSKRMSLINSIDVNKNSDGLFSSSLGLIINDSSKTFPKIIKHAENLSVLFPGLSLNHSSKFIVLNKEDALYKKLITIDPLIEFKEYSLTELYANADFSNYESNKMVEKRPKSPNVIKYSQSKNGKWESESHCLTSSEVKDLSGLFIGIYGERLCDIDVKDAKNSSISNTDSVKSYYDGTLVSSNVLNHPDISGEDVYVVRPNAWKYINEDEMVSIVDWVTEHAVEHEKKKTYLTHSPFGIWSLYSNFQGDRSILNKLIDNTKYTTNEYDTYYFSLINNTTFFIKDNGVNDKYKKAKVKILNEFNQLASDIKASHPVLCYLMQNWYSICNIPEVNKQLLKLI